MIPTTIRSGGDAGIELPVPKGTSGAENPNGPAAAESPT